MGWHPTLPHASPFVGIRSHDPPCSRSNPWHGGSWRCPCRCRASRKGRRDPSDLPVCTLFPFVCSIPHGRAEKARCVETGRNRTPFVRSILSCPRRGEGAKDRSAPIVCGGIPLVRSLAEGAKARSSDLRVNGSRHRYTSRGEAPSGNPPDRSCPAEGAKGAVFGAISDRQEGGGEGDSVCGSVAPLPSTISNEPILVLLHVVHLARTE